MFDFAKNKLLTSLQARISFFLKIVVARIKPHMKILRLKYLIFRENLRIYPFRFISELSLITLDIEYITDNNDSRLKFCELIKDAISKKATVDKNIYDIQKIYIPILIMYMLVKVGLLKNANLLGGVFGNDKGIDEFAVLAMSIVGLYITPQYATSLRLGHFIMTSIDRSKDNEFLYFEKVIHTTFEAMNPYFPVCLPFLSTTTITSNLKKAFMLLYYLPVLSILASVYFGRFYIAYNMYIASSYGNITTFIYVLFIYVEVISIFYFGLIYLPLPHRDYTWLNEQDLLSQIDKRQLKNRRQEMYGILWRYCRIIDYINRHRHKK